MASHTTKVFGQIQMINNGFNEVQALKSALANTTIPFDASLLDTGIVRVDWNGSAIVNRITAFNDDFARAVDEVVRHPEMEGMGLYGQFIVISNSFNDTLGMTNITVCDGRVFVEKGEPAWTTPIRMI